MDPTSAPASPPVPNAYSRVNVPLEIPFETLSQLVNQRIPPVLFAEEGLDLGSGVRGDLNFSRDGWIQVKGVDSSRLELTVPLKVTGEVGLKPGGLRNLFQNKIPINQSLSPVFQVDPKIFPNWALGVSDFELLDLGGKMGLNFMGLELDLSTLIQKEVSAYASEKLEGKKDLLQLKPLVDQAWSEAGKPVFVDLLGKKMAFSIQPDSVKIHEKVDVDRGYQLFLGLSGKVNPHPASAAPSRAFPLPSFSDNVMEDNYLEIRVPLFLGYAELNELLDSNFENQRIPISKSAYFSPSNFQTQAFGEKLGIWMDFIAVEKEDKEITGRLFLVGKPDFDPEEKTLIFREVDFYLESESGRAKLGAKLKRGKIIRQLNSKMRFPLEETFAMGLEGIENRLGLQTPIADLKVVGLEMAPEGFYPGKLGLSIHLMATGEVEVRWK
ncbi:hypothetical protein GCM10027164_25270 [Algoriphagus taiwanensis]